MAKYRKKPVVIDAEVYKEGMEDGYILETQDGDLFFHKEKDGAELNLLHSADREALIPAVETLEGYHKITKGDYIVTGVKGERYSCKPDIFEMTYEEVEDSER